MSNNIKLFNAKIVGKTIRWANLVVDARLHDKKAAENFRKAAAQKK